MAMKKRASRGPAKAAQAGKTKSAHGAKTAFVRSLPADLSAKDVVAKGKEQGLVLSEAYVYKIRSTSKPSGVSGSRRASDAEAVTSTTPGAGSSASDFVRSLPPDISAKQAVELAKKEGIPLTTGYFYTLRSTFKRAGNAGRVSSKGRGAAASGGLGLRLSSRNPHEQAVLDAVEALGAARVRSLVDAAEKLGP